MLNFTFHTPETSTGPTKDLLLNIQKQYGFIPNLFAFMAEAPVTIEAYLTLNELISRTSLAPAERQVALLAASLENSCDFCSTAHRAMAKLNEVNEQTLTALASGVGIQDPRDRAITDFTRAVISKNGRPSEADVQAFLEAGFSKQQILEVILIVTIKTLSNYINNLTKPTPNPEFLAMAQAQSNAKDN